MRPEIRKRLGAIGLGLSLLAMPIAAAYADTTSTVTVKRISSGDAATTYVASHGIYAKTKASLVLTADINDPDSEIKEFTLRSDSDGLLLPDEALTFEGQSADFEASPALEGPVSDANIYLCWTYNTRPVETGEFDEYGEPVTEDRPIAEPDEVLAGGPVTIEADPPEFSVSIDGTGLGSDTRGSIESVWRNKAAELAFDLSDALSGIRTLTVTEDGRELYSRNWKDKCMADSLTVKADPKESADGSHSYEVILTDNSGNSSSESFSLLFDKESPKVKISGAMDGAFCRRLPGIEVTDDESHYKAEGHLLTADILRDGTLIRSITTKDRSLSIPSSEFEKDGLYTVRASAVDAAGNRSGKEKVSFTVDRTKPEVEIRTLRRVASKERQKDGTYKKVYSLKSLKGPNANGWYNVRPYLKGIAKDTTSGLDSLKLNQIYGEDSFVTLADRELSGSAAKESITKASEPLSYNSKTGTYTFRAYATDRAGNRSTRSVKLKIDTVSPVLNISGAENGGYYRSAPSVKLTEDEQYYRAKGAYIHIEVKRDGSVIYKKKASRVNAFSVPKSILGSDGRYKVTAYAMDAAGNRSAACALRFTIDRTAPKINITGASGGRYYSRPQEVTVTLTEKNYSLADAAVTVTRKLGNKTSRETFPLKPDRFRSSLSRTLSGPGTYTVAARAKDKAGNSVSAQPITFTVDCKAPVIDIKGITAGRTYGYGESPSPSVSFTDDYPSSKSVTWTKNGKPVSEPDFGMLRESDGHYEITASAKDKAGNSASKKVSFVLNRFGSVYTYSKALNDAIGRSFTDAPSGIEITEENASPVSSSEVRITLDGSRLDATGTTSRGKDGTLTHRFAPELFETEGTYEIDVVSKDEAGNETESKSENGTASFSVDRTPPQISILGNDPLGNRGESVTLTLDVTDTVSGPAKVTAKLDGEPVAVNEAEDGTLTVNIGRGVNRTLTVTAEDNAGNSASCEESVSVSPSAARLFISRNLKRIGLGASIAALAAILAAVLKKRRKETKDADDIRTA